MGDPTSGSAGGFTLEVKATHYRTGYLLMPHNRPYLPERCFGALVIVPGNPIERIMDIAGFITWTGFERHQEWMRKWKKPTYAVAQEHLTPIEELLEWHHGVRAHAPAS